MFLPVCDALKLRHGGGRFVATATGRGKTLPHAFAMVKKRADESLLKSTAYGGCCFAMAKHPRKIFDPIPSPWRRLGV